MPTGNIIGTFFGKEDGKTYYCKEGALTVQTGYSTLNAARQDFLQLADEIKAENFIKFTKGEEMTIQNVVKGDVATHITMYYPEWEEGPIPTAAAADGAYSRRMVTAFRLTTGEMQLPLSSTNSAIKAGDTVELDPATMGLEKAATGSASKVTALQDKAANTGGYILVDLREPAIPCKSA